MLILVFRGIFLIGILSWYSTNVWKMIDGYFKERFEKYLQQEYQKNPKMRDDVEAYGIASEEPGKGRTTPDDDDDGRGTSETTEINEKKRNCERFDALGEETCPIDSVDMGAVVAGLQPGSGSSIVALNAKDTMDDHTSNNRFGEGDKGGRYLRDISSGLKKGSKNSGENPTADIVAKENPVESILAVREVTDIDETSKASERKQTVVHSDLDSAAAADADAAVADGENDAKKAKMKNITRGRGKSLRKKQGKRDLVRRDKKEEKKKKDRVKTIILTDEDFQKAKLRLGLQDYDFSEFDDEEGEDVEAVEELPEGILVSELPFKPRADIGKLERVTYEEFCPLSLEEEADCGKTESWP